MTRNDAFWDDLGVAWCAINPAVDVIMPRLRARLRRQSLLITAGLSCGLPLGIAGLLLGAFTIWRGQTTGAWNFITRGAAIVAISVLLLVACSRLFRVRATDDAKSLSEMIDLAIARRERTLAAIRLALYACAVAAALGLAGTAIRMHFSRPPAMSPVVDLVILALIAAVLFLYRTYATADLEKFRYLKRALAVSEA
jgi:hypothetical protein